MATTSGPLDLNMCSGVHYSLVSTMMSGVHVGNPCPQPRTLGRRDAPRPGPTPRVQPRRLPPRAPAGRSHAQAPRVGRQAEGTAGRIPAEVRRARRQRRADPPGPRRARMIVVDASIAAKWFLAEDATPLANALLQGT